ncbi:hypothetical protein Tco_0832667 [Tanacetum coccineum]
MGGGGGEGGRGGEGGGKTAKYGETLSCELTVSSLNKEIDFRISFDDSDDEDNTVVFDNNSFSYKIISTNDLKTDSENDNEKVMPSLPSPEPAVSCFDDLDFFKDFENEFSAIVMLFYLIMNLYVPFGIPLDPKRYYKDGIYTGMIAEAKGLVYRFRDMALPPRNQRHQYLRYEGLQYTDDDIADFKTRLARIYSREVHMVQVFDFGGLLDLMAEGLSVRMLIEHRNAQGQSVFTSQAWRRLFDIRGPLVHELILEFFSTFRFGKLRRCRLLDSIHTRPRVRDRSPARGIRGLVERLMTDHGRFSTWMISCMVQLMEASGLTYEAFDGTFLESSHAAFKRRTRQRTGEASTSTTQQDP